MDTILAYLVSFSDFFTSIVTWGIKNPDAFFLYFLLINRVIAHLPIGGRGKDIIDIIINAFGKAAARKGLKLDAVK